MVSKFICHGKPILRIAKEYGWLPGARYTNLRDVREFDRVGFLDIDWKNYSFSTHLQAAKSTRPKLTIARDLMDLDDLPAIIDEANELLQYADSVAIVPKADGCGPALEDIVPKQFLFAYSVPTSYGGTRVPSRFFRREVHLLGGHPATQRALANQLRVRSFDCNRFTLDARFGDYFDGFKFRPHPEGGYERCLRASLANVNGIWQDTMGCYDRMNRDIRQSHLPLGDLVPSSL